MLKISLLAIHIIKALLLVCTVFSIIVFWESDDVPKWITTILGLLVISLIRSIDGQKVVSYFGSPKKYAVVTKPDIDELLASENPTDSIIELDDYICHLCEFGDNLELLNEPQKYFFFNQSLEREVNNGGFSQYFINSTGEFAHETIISLKAMGANKTEEILQKAIALFPKKIIPKDEASRREKIELLSEEIWEDLDQAFFKYEDDLNFLTIEYIRRNKDKFS